MNKRTISETSVLSFKWSVFDVLPNSWTFQAAQQEALVANGEAARLERDLAHARTAALANGMGVKSRFQALQFELSTLSIGIGVLRI
jgi:hypothetical protein